ncbi:MAG: DNA primase, partial [Pseudomonadota bacterium]
MPSDPMQLVLSRLEGVRRSGNGWTARCPAHDDRNASLSINEGDGGVLLHCFAGCEKPAIMAALGMTLADLFADRPKDQTPTATKINLADLARDKGLPVDFLKALGLHD